jgi:hypothetical protein
VTAPPPIVRVQNDMGHWVPAIPLPHYGMFGKWCGCGRGFLRSRTYEGHYALVHILGMEGKR